MAQNSIILFTIGVIITKFSSFLINVVLSYKYGASVISDAIIISLNIPIILFSGFIAAISMCYIPLYKKAELETRERAVKITALIMNVLTIVGASICILLFIFPAYFVRIFANGMSLDGIALASQITQWVAVASLLVPATGVLEGYMQANGQFRLVSISRLPVNMILLSCILISSEESIVYFLGTGIIFAQIFNFVLFFCSARKNYFIWRCIFDFKNPYLKKLFITVMPVILGTLLYDINAIVDKSFASFLGAGNISILDYAYKVAASAQGILAFPLTTILYTKLATESSRKDIIALSESVNQGIRKLSFFMIPAISGMMVTADIITNVLFLRGDFSTDAAQATSKCLVLYLIGMYAISYRALFEKVFYSLHLTKVTLWNTIITVLSNIIFDLLFFKIFDCYGLALATSISLIISLFYLIRLMREETGVVLERGALGDIFKMVMSAGVMSIGIFVSKQLLIGNVFSLRTGNIIELFSLFLMGAIIYYLILLILRETQSQKFLKTLRTYL